MTDKTALRQLIEAVEAGKWSDGKTQNFGVLHHMGLDAARAYNGSLDAAKALHDALLPGWAIERMAWWPRGEYYVLLLGTHEGEDGTIHHGSADGRAEGCDGIQARAWLIAILKAYEAQQ